MVKDKRVVMILYKHKCYGCGIELEDELFFEDGKFWVEDFCGNCIGEDLNKKRAVQEVKLDEI